MKDTEDQTRSLVEVFPELGGRVKNPKIFTFVQWAQFYVQPMIPFQLHKSHHPVCLATTCVCMCANWDWLSAEPIISLWSSHLSVLTFNARLPADHHPTRAGKTVRPDNWAFVLVCNRYIVSLSYFSSASGVDSWSLTVLVERFLYFSF